MLRGNAPATIDSKGRLKVPARYRGRIEEAHGNRFYITSDNGLAVQIYPLPLWEAFEIRLAALPRYNDAAMRLRDRLSYFGAEAQMDKQGRLLIHPLVRLATDTTGEVDVLGQSDHLQVWNKERFIERMETQPLELKHRQELSDLGL